MCINTWGKDFPPLLTRRVSWLTPALTGRCSLRQGTKLWIIMEYLGGGSALDLMKAGSFEEIHISIILREVIKGLDYLHSERKLHRDIKGSAPERPARPSG